MVCWSVFAASSLGAADMQNRAANDAKRQIVRVIQISCRPWLNAPNHDFRLQTPGCVQGAARDRVDHSCPASLQLKPTRTFTASKNGGHRCKRLALVSKTSLRFCL